MFFFLGGKKKELVVSQSLPDRCEPGLTRCQDHVDFGSVTLLVQDSAGGLQIKDKRGKGWIPAPPMPGTVLVRKKTTMLLQTFQYIFLTFDVRKVNLGDEMEIFTNGLYAATRHRVVAPEDEAGRGRHRQSIAFFVTSDYSATLRPVLGEEPLLPRYGPVNARRHYDSYLGQTNLPVVADQEQEK